MKKKGESNRKMISKEEKNRQSVNKETAKGTKEISGNFERTAKRTRLGWAEKGKEKGANSNIM